MPPLQPCRFLSVLLFAGSTVVLTAVGGCADGGSVDADGPGSSRWDGSIRDSAGVRIVSNPDRGTWTEPWRVEEVLRLGASDGPPELVFGRVRSVAAGIDGQIYVLDSQTRMIRAFDASGAYLFSVGRAGEGPGEISAPTALLVDARGRLVIPDPIAQRVTRFTPDGQLAEVIALRFPGGLTQRWGIVKDGGLIHQIEILEGDGSMGPVSRVLHHRSDLTVTDTLMKLAPVRAVLRNGGRMTFRPFQPAPMFRALDDNRFAFALDSIHRVEIRDLSGRLKQVIEKAAVPQKIGRKDQQSYIQGISQQFSRDMGGSLDHVRWDFPQRFPVLADVRLGPEGTLWVQHSYRTGELTDPRVDVTDQGSNRWDIFNAEGQYLGIIELPRGFTLHAIRGDLAYGAGQEEPGSPIVLILRIVRAVAAPA